MRQSVRAIVINDNKLLIMDRDRFGFKFQSLIGGGIDIGEDAETALHREVMEETGLTIANPRLVIVEEAGEVYGQQLIYLCDYVSGEPKLQADSTEAKINADGKNLYQPKWLDLTELAGSNLLPIELKELLMRFIKDGFPAKPVELLINHDSKL